MKVSQFFYLSLALLVSLQARAATDALVARELTTVRTPKTQQQKSQDTSVGNLAGFKGLQLLPSLDGKWTPGAFDDLKPRVGILQFPIGPVIMTNAFSDHASQLGASLKFSHELVAIKRKNNTLLLVNSRGDPIAVFDLGQRGQQMYPAPMRNTASLVSDEPQVSFNNGSKLFFKKLNFLNYRGEQLYLLNKLSTPGGQDIGISFEIDPASMTAVYSHVGSMSVKGDAKSGKVTFQDTKRPALIFTLEYNAGRLVAARGTANEIIAEFQTSNGLVASVTDKYGYKTSFSYAGERWTGHCSHYGECVTSTYAEKTITTKKNTENYSATVTFDLMRGVPIGMAYAGWTSNFSYESSGLLVPWRIVRETTRSRTGANVTSEYKYDSSGRLVKFWDSTGLQTTYSYAVTQEPIKYREPVAVTTTLAGKTIKDLRLSYTSTGLIEQVQNLLVAGTSPLRSIAYSYNARRQLDAVRFGDGTVKDFQYDDARFPDFATALLTNGYGAVAAFDSNGQLSQLSSFPEGLRREYGYNQGGLLTSVTASAPAFGSATSWTGGYASGAYLSDERISETAQGSTVTTYNARYTWDSRYRSVIATTRDQADLKVGLPNGTVPLRSFISDSSLKTTQATSASPAGVRADASGCSPCACPVETDAETGATVSGGSQCDPSIRLQVAPAGQQRKGS